MGEGGENLVICPGCGVVLPNRHLELNDRYASSGECWNLFMKLSEYTQSLYDPSFPHQIAVDAYGAQHAGPTSRSITTAFALIGLCLLFNWGYTGRQVQKVHMILANRSKDWPRFNPPGIKDGLTVQDVIRAEHGGERDRMLRVWAESVWATWKKDHENVAKLIKKHIDPERLIWKL